MKKFLTLLFCAATFAGMSWALPAAGVGVKGIAKAHADVQSLPLMQFDPAQLAPSQVVGKAVNHNGMMKAAPAAQDLSNIYGYGFYSMSGSDGDDYIYQSMQIEINGNDVTLYGIFYGYPIHGTFDSETGDITVLPQDIVMNTYYDEMMKLYTQELTLDADGNYLGMVNVPSIVFHYCPDGVQLSNGDIICVGGYVAEDYKIFTVSMDSIVDQNRGFMWHYMNRLPPMGELYPDAPMFKFVADEWEELGTAKLTEGWFAPGFFNEAPTYEVPVLRNVNKPTDLLLVNPYGDNTPFADFNTATNKNGYIYLNIENPRLVLVRPNVVSGFENSQYISECSLANTTKEGVSIYMNGNDPHDVLETAIYFDDPVGTLNNNMIELPNCLFQVGNDMQTTVCWHDNNGDPIPMVSIIELPDLSQGSDPQDPVNPLYIVGSADNLEWDPVSPAEFDYVDGKYVFEAQNVSMFKISTEIGDWDIFNANALGYPGYDSTPGVTLPLIQTDYNTICPWIGDYTIEVAGDLSTLILYTDSENPNTAVEIYLRGYMSGWDASEDWKFTNLDGDIYKFTCADDQAIFADEPFKIADANWAIVNYGVMEVGEILNLDTTNALVYDGCNINLSADWNGVAYFKLSTGELFMSNDKDALPQFGEGEDPQEPEKCEVPEISLVDNMLVAICRTEGATVHVSIVAEDQQNLAAEGEVAISLTGIYQVRAYATCEGMTRSEETYATLIWTNVEDLSDVESIPMEQKRPILIRTVGENIEVVGTIEGEHIELCTLSGAKIYGGKALEGVTRIPTALQNGEVYIVIVGQKSVKYKL